MYTERQLQTNARKSTEVKKKREKKCTLMHVYAMVKESRRVVEPKMIALTIETYLQFDAIVPFLR